MVEKNPLIKGVKSHNNSVLRWSFLGPEGVCCLTDERWSVSKTELISHTHSLALPQQERAAESGRSSSSDNSSSYCIYELDLQSYVT